MVIKDCGFGGASSEFLVGDSEGARLVTMREPSYCDGLIMGRKKVRGNSKIGLERVLAQEKCSNEPDHFLSIALTV